eukprot:120795_1
MAENAATTSIREVVSAQSYIKDKYSDTIGLATSILGQVLLGTLQGSKRRKEVIKLCLKDMKHQFSDRVAEDPRTEIAFMKTICNRSHPNFVRFIDAVEDHKLYCMCIEYVSGGDMCTYIQNLRTGIDAPRAKRYAIQLTKAVYFMHCNGYCHLDLSLENVLWDKKNDLLKICDFGLARSFPHHDVNAMFQAATIRPGKKGYMAPEIYAYQRFNGEKADVFSLGVIIFILLTGFPPFTTPNASDKCFQYMYYGKLEWLLKQWKLNDIIDAECRVLLSKIFCHPKKRIGIKQVLESAWLDQNMEDIDLEMTSYTKHETTTQETPHVDEVENTLQHTTKEVKEGIVDKKKRKSVPRLVKKKRKKSKKTTQHSSNTSHKVSNPTRIAKKQRERGKSKSIAHIQMAHVLLNESSTTLLSDTAATVSIKGRNGDDAGKSRRTRSKSLSYSHHHHHSSYSFMNDLKLLKQTKTNKSMNTHNVQQIRRDSVCSASSNSGRDSEESQDHKQQTKKQCKTHANETRGSRTHRAHTANMREHEALNQTQLITQKYGNNGNFTPHNENDSYFDNDRKEGDDETYPYHEHNEAHERQSVHIEPHQDEERRLSNASSQDAGSVHATDSPTQSNKPTAQHKNNKNSKETTAHPPV